MAGLTEEEWQAQQEGGVANGNSAGAQQSGTAAQTQAQTQSGSGSSADDDDDDFSVDTSGLDNRIATYMDEMAALKPKETEEQRKKRERQEKSARIVSAVSNGVRALSNLFFTTKYAPNMYNHEKGNMLTAQDAAIEKARKEREENHDAHLKLALSLHDAEQERANLIASERAKHKEMKMKQKKADQEALLFGDKQREQKAKADERKEKARAAKVVADTTPEMQQSKLRTENARTESYQTASQKNRAVAGSQGSIHHFNGKEYRNNTKDYEKDVRKAATEYNERHKNEEGFVPIAVDRVKKTAYGNESVARKAEEYAGELETRLAEEKEQQAQNKQPDSGKGAGYGGSNGKGAGYGGKNKD